jgi:hypothetical protein
MPLPEPVTIANDAGSGDLGAVDDIGVLDQRGGIHGHDRSAAFNRRRHGGAEDVGNCAIDDDIGHIGDPLERNGSNWAAESLEILARTIKVACGNADQAKSRNAPVEVAPDQPAD